VELSPDLFSLSHRSARFVGRRGSVRWELWDGTRQGSFDGCFRFLWALLLRRPLFHVCGARSNGKLLDRDKGGSKLALTDADLLRAMPQTRMLEGKFRCCTSRQNCPRRAHRDDCFITSFSLNAAITGVVRYYGERISNFASILWRTGRASRPELGFRRAHNRVVSRPSATAESHVQPNSQLCPIPRSPT
jgi:hypothetical protein